MIENAVVVFQKFFFLTQRMKIILVSGEKGIRLLFFSFTVKVSLDTSSGN